MTDGPTEDAIIDAVRAAGWLLEQEAAKTLEANGFTAVSAWPYTDPDEPSTSRELDVYAFKSLLDIADLRLSVSSRVLVECKANVAPYALIGRRVTADRNWPPPFEHCMPFRGIDVPIMLPGGRMGTHDVSPWFGLGLDDIDGSPSRDIFRASQFVHLERKGARWEAKNDGIFNSVVFPLAKALEAAWPSSRQRGRPWATTGAGARGPNDADQIVLRFPLVLTAAPLFTVDTTDGEPVVKEVPWATTMRSLKSKSTTGQFRIDVVNASAFQQYMTDRVDLFSRAVVRKVKEVPESFVFGPGVRSS